ncbi:MAG: hypothetical protein WAW80_00095 [Candidatus Saccharimonadales bacterium]
MNKENNDNRQTSDSQQAIGREVMSVLNSCTLNMPKEQTLQELLIVVERLTFSRESMGSDLSMATVEDVLGGDVTPDIIEFVHWMHRRKLLGLLVGENGRTFLRFSTRYYRSIKEVRCITPITISESYKIKLLTHLRMIYPEPARIVFEVVPSLILGCIIDDGVDRVDMSLMSESPQLIKKYITALKPLGDHSHGV